MTFLMTNLRGINRKKKKWFFYFLVTHHFEENIQKPQSILLIVADLSMIHVFVEIFQRYLSFLATLHVMLS